MTRKRGGFAFPLLILAVVVVAGFVATLGTMNRGLKTQLIRTDTNHFSFILAYSVMSKVLGKIHAAPWNARPFKVKPYTEYGASLHDGTYDLWVENTPGKEFRADIYVRTILAGQANLYFWRIRFLDDFLDISNRIFIECFKRGEPRDFPQSPGSSFAKRIDDLLQQRRGNQGASDRMAASIEGINDPGKIAAIFGGRPMAKFPEPYPALPDSPEAILQEKAKNPVSFPDLNPGPPAPPPPPAPEAPPAQTSGLDTVKKLTDQIAKGAEEAVKSMKTAIDLFQGGGSSSEIGAAAAQADKSLRAMVSSMESLLSQAPQILTGLPGQETSRTAQDMIVSSVLSGMQTFVDCMNLNLAGIFKPSCTNIVKGGFSIAQKEQQIDMMRDGITEIEKKIGTLKTLGDTMGPMASDPDFSNTISRIIGDGTRILDAQKALLQQTEAAVAAQKQAGAP